MRIDSGYKLKDGTSLTYEIYENGFDIFRGMNSENCVLHQPEPHIPNPDISYEENAKNMCFEISERSKNQPENTEYVLTKTEYISIRSDLDYLMLLNDPDSATEDTAN